MFLQKFAGEGLRTLCLAIRDLDEEFFNDWKHRHQEAAMSLENRDEKLDAIYEEIEKDMFLLGKFHSQFILLLLQRKYLYLSVEHAQ